jgi:hypothetical protein
MHALEYQAGVTMILYKGRFGGGDLATAQPDLGAVAFTLKHIDN